MSDQGAGAPHWPITARHPQHWPMGACVLSVSAASSDASLWWRGLVRCKQVENTRICVAMNIQCLGERSIIWSLSHLGRLRGIGLQSNKEISTLRQYCELQKPKAGNPRPGISKQNSISPSLQNICDIESYFALLSLVSSRNLGLWLADLGSSVVLAGDRLFI